MLNDIDVLQTLEMINSQHLDIRTITMHISLFDCVSSSVKETCDKVYKKLVSRADGLKATADFIQSKYGIPIVNKRVSVTPIALVAASCEAVDYTPLEIGRAHV